MKRKKPKIHAMDDEKEQLLLEAAEYGDLESCRELLAKGADPGARTGNNKETALILASKYGHLDVAKILLPLSDVRAGDIHDNTALIWAAFEGYADIVRLLLPLSDVNARNKDGIHALELAHSYGHQEAERAIFAYIRSQEEAKELDDELTAKTDAITRNPGI